MKASGACRAMYMKDVDADNYGGLQVQRGRRDCIQDLEVVIEMGDVSGGRRVFQAFRICLEGELGGERGMRKVHTYLHK